MAQEPSCSAATAAVATGSSWLRTAGVAAGAAAVTGCCFLAARRLSRLVAARRRLAALLAEAAGEEARVVVTGATSGIGRELAGQLVRHPALSLLVGCRDAQAGERIFARTGRVRVARLELLDPDSVQSFADEAHEFLRGGGPGLRLLVNNAGAMRPPGRAPGAAAGGDPTWRINFLAPFLLTELLARRRATDGVQLPLRVVQVSSRLERRSKLTEEMLDRVANGEVGDSAYADSKRALMLWTSVRAQSLAFKGNAFTHCSTPGLADTQLGRYSVHPWLWPLTKPIRFLLLRSPAEGALAAVAVGLLPQAVDSFGRYNDGERQVEDLVLERMGEKPFATKLVKWATQATALEARVAGYDR